MLAFEVGALWGPMLLTGTTCAAFALLPNHISRMLLAQLHTRGHVSHTSDIPVSKKAFAQYICMIYMYIHVYTIVLHDAYSPQKMGYIKWRPLYTYPYTHN